MKKGVAICKKEWYNNEVAWGKHKQQKGLKAQKKLLKSNERDFKKLLKSNERDFKKLWKTLKKVLTNENECDIIIHALLREVR